MLAFNGGAWTPGRWPQDPSIVAALLLLCEVWQLDSAMAAVPRSRRQILRPMGLWIAVYSDLRWDGGGCGSLLMPAGLL
jgi:hypothetical protein